MCFSVFPSMNVFYSQPSNHVIVKLMPHVFRKALEEIANQKRPGPSATFSVFHLAHALELIAEKEIGRSKLARRLGVGEGAIRTIIERLKEAGLVTVSREGCALTDKGMSLWKSYSSKLRKIEIPKSDLTLGKFNCAILVRNAGARVKSGIEQRDAAVMMGAKNAITVMAKRGLLIIPSVSDDVAKDFPEATDELLKTLKPCENDVIVIAGDETLEKAEYGALAAAWTLLNGD